jgi:CheY-like chemotaxis protein
MNDKYASPKLAESMSLYELIKQMQEPRAATAMSQPSAHESCSTRRTAQSPPGRVLMPEREPPPHACISLGESRLTGKSVLVVEDEPLIAMTVESGLQDAGATAIRIAASISAARIAINVGAVFDAAVIDLHVADGDASSLIEVLTERGIPVVVTTGDSADREAPDLSKALAVLRKPYPEADLIKVLAWMVI